LELLDVKGILNNLFILLNPTFVAKGILFEIVLPGTEVFIEADPGLIEQLLINLCLNAIDAVKNANNPSVSVSAFKDDDQNSGRTTIKIKDNGMGMEDEVLNKVFIPFFTTKKNGNGIGLSLCKQIMVLHKGNIYVQSVQGKGTTFILRF
ncbi:MAG: integral rane sensor signal transduction histidine kinase, partial [Chitinophagaceae bacterium]|nr:integral rane sensor signal transduction histidine kinase [Chitinophagaceae bacterium]